jgi:hypothetical protein
MNLIRTGRSELRRWICSLFINRPLTHHPGRPILCNSIPKAGTHLLIRCLGLRTGITDSGLRARGTIDPDVLRR